MKIKIEYIKREDKLTKPMLPEFPNGKPYKRVTVAMGGKYYSAGDFDGWTSQWDKGMEIDVPVEEKEVDGKIFNNIKKPSKAQYLVGGLEERIAKIERILESNNLVENFNVKEPEEDYEKDENSVDMGELPF